MSRVWPLLRLLDKVAVRTDETIIGFSMDRARDDAWTVAQSLGSLDQAAQAELIAELDGQVARRGRLLRHPGLLIAFVTTSGRLSMTDGRASRTPRPFLRKERNDGRGVDRGQ